MDITTMKPIAPNETLRDRSARPRTTYRLVSPLCVPFQGTTLPGAGCTTVAPWGADGATPATGARVGADQRTNAMTHPSIDAFSFRRRRPPV